MNIRVKLYGVFATAAKTRQLDLTIPEENVTVKSAITHLLSNKALADLQQILLDSETLDPRPNALIMVSGREINSLDGLNTYLTDADELDLLPVAHGG